MARGLRDSAKIIKIAERFIILKFPIQLHFSLESYAFCPPHFIGKLDKTWMTKSTSFKTKMKQYWALMLPVLVYGSKCWTLRKEDERRLLVAEIAWLRGIRGRSRREQIRIEKTREELGTEETVIEKIKRRRLTWFGHVKR